MKATHEVRWIRHDEKEEERVQGQWSDCLKLYDLLKPIVLQVTMGRIAE